MSDSLYAINGDATGGGGGGGLPSGTSGALLYYDGTAWAALPLGTAGYILRATTLAGPAWRELSAVGVIGDRVVAGEAREGQTYWATDGASGLQLSMCVHQGGGSYAWTNLAYGVTATGAAIVQASSATAGRSALGWTITANPMTGVGWTTAAGAGSTAMWGAGKLAMHLDAGSTTTATGSEIASLLTDDEDYDIMARVDVVTGNGSTICNVSLWAGRDASNCVLFQLWINGDVGAGLFVGGAYTSLLNATAATSGGDRTGGQLWGRITRTRTAVAMFWGVGVADALPTSWTCAYAGTLSAVGAQTPSVLTSSQGTYARLDLYCGAPLGTDLDVDVLALTTTAQGGARL